MNTETGIISYKKLYGLMGEKFNLQKDRITIPELNQEIYNIDFNSPVHDELPQEDAHIKKNPAFLALLKYYLSRSVAANREIFNSLKTPDKDIEENNKFRFPFLKPGGRKKCRGAIILLHGLNERSWQKYLPWASRLADETGKGIILFPLAFHMNRSPESWSQIRRMMPVSKERKTLLPDLTSSSFANAAISYRMQFAPQRFILSGIQTFMDLVHLIKKIKEGNISGLESQCSIDFFAYSIGATLAEVLMMTNPRGYLTQSKAFLFCGGPALDLSTPINKVIIDNHAFNSLLHHFHDILDGKADELKSIEDVISNNSYKYLKSLLIHNRMEKTRNNRLIEIQDRIRFLALEKDRTMPPEALEKTMKPAGIDIKSCDFPFSYSHENPFPMTPGKEDAVEKAFTQIFSEASGFIA